MTEVSNLGVVKKGILDNQTKKLQMRLSFILIFFFYER